MDNLAGTARRPRYPTADKVTIVNGDTVMLIGAVTRVLVAAGASPGEIDAFHDEIGSARDFTDAATIAATWVRIEGAADTP